MTRPTRRPAKAPPPVRRCGTGSPAGAPAPLPLSPELRQALRSKLSEAALDQLSSDLLSASRTLAFLARTARSEATRLAAAKAVIELQARLREQGELEARIADLEAQK